MIAYKYKDFLSVKKFNVKIKNQIIKDFHEIRLKDASLMILKNLKTNKYLILSEYRVAFKKKMPGLLGGFVDNNETPLQCIKREAKEEIGIKPKNIKFLNKFVRNSNYHCGIDHVFYGETETINLTMESNISYFWISENELKNKFLKKNLFKNPGFFSAVTLYLLSKKKL